MRERELGGEIFVRTPVFEPQGFARTRNPTLGVGGGALGAGGGAPGGRGHRAGLHEAFPRCHLCKKGVREWGLGFVDSGVAGTGADDPAKLNEGDLNRPRYFHRKRFLENNCV